MRIMACCLMVPSNYLEQRWLIVSNAAFTSQRMHNVFVFIIEFEFHRLRIRIRNIYCSNVTKIYRGICVEIIKIYMTNTKILTLSIRVGLSHSLHLHMYTNTHWRAKTDSTQITHTHETESKDLRLMTCIIEMVKSKLETRDDILDFFSQFHGPYYWRTSE